jgi:26S proteasome regulatory subunit N3
VEVASFVRVTFTSLFTVDTMPDVEMKPADADKKDGKDEKDDKKEKKDEKKEEPKPVPPSPASEIKSNAALIERAVSTLEPRFTHRVLRTLAVLRKKIDESVLREAIHDVFPEGESGG